MIADLQAIQALQGESNIFRLATERRRRWQREMNGLPEIVGSETAASIFDGAGRAIFIGVSTGVLVWATTRILSSVFPVEAKRR